NAYALLGLTQATKPSPATLEVVALAAGRLNEAWRSGDAGWRWFESELTYDNARLPQALIAAAHRLGDRTMMRRGSQSLDWYARQVGLATGDGVLRTVTNLWRSRGPSPAPGGEAAGHEQPIDAAATVEALVEAYRATGEAHY